MKSVKAPEIHSDPGSGPSESGRPRSGSWRILAEAAPLFGEPIYFIEPGEGEESLKLNWENCIEVPFKSPDDVS